MDYRKLTLAETYAEAESIASDAQSFFGGLDAKQLNWKPSADAWSVAQCLEPLNKINRAYYPTFDQLLKGEYRHRLLHHVPILPRLFGGIMIEQLSPEVRKKYKAPPSARPAASSVDPSIVETFVTQQRETLAKMRALETRRPAKTVITSPFAAGIVYSLLDSFRLIVAHERRHFAQARRVMETDGFPERAAR